MGRCHMKLLKYVELKHLFHHVYAAGISMRKRFALYIVSSISAFLAIILLLLSLFGILTPTDKQILEGLDARLLAYTDNIESDFDQLLCIPQAIVQINAESLRYRPSRKQVQKWLASGVPIVYGSDTHNLTTRPPVFHKVSRWLSHPHGGVVPAQLANRLADELGLL